MSAITNYLDLDLLIEKDDDSYRARVIGSPGGQASSKFPPPFSRLEPAQRAFRETRLHALEWIARKRLLQGEHWLAIEACGAALTAELRQSAHHLMAEIYRAEGNEVLAVRRLADTWKFLEAELN